jgi:hypothetical protein
MGPAQAPWTSTTVGFAALEADAEATRVDAFSRTSAPKLRRAASVVSNNQVSADRLAARAAWTSSFGG